VHNRQISKIERGIFFLCRCKYIGQNLQFDCCIVIFHGTTTHCLLVSNGNRGGGSIFSLVSLYCNVKHIWFYAQFEEDEIS
jgi:hypothetical protein